MVKLNLGSGDLPAKAPWVNVDSWPGNKPDVVADICRLPWDDATVSHIYCGHVLEHLDKSAVLRALCEFRRLFVPGGRLCVVGPDLHRASSGDGDPTRVDDVLTDVIRTGGDRWPGDRHLWESTETSALALIRQMFPNARAIPITEVDRSEWPLPFDAWWQFAIEGEV